MALGHGFRIRGLFSVLLFSQVIHSAGEATSTNDVKRPATVVATNLPSSFQVKRGFRIQLVAPEGMVSSPVAMAFDENGRLFVVEMRDYPEGRAQNPHLGRVRLLEDTDGDGIFDSSTIYADNLAWPSAVACYGGGIFVAATPEVIYFKNNTDTGLADERKIVFSGFGTLPGAPNPEALLNSFVWGLDNRIYGGSAGIGGVVAPVGAPGAAPVTLGHEDFSFDPRTLIIRTEAGSAHTGLCFDNRGRKYVSDLAHPLQAVMFPARYLARNPFFPKPPELTDVISPTDVIFRFAGNQTRVAGAARPPGTAGQSDRLIPALMSKARGCLIYRGNAFPSNYIGNVFVADPEAHIIHHATLVANGLEFVGQRPADEQNTEFLVSRDPSFHPTQIISGPDGALYVADMQTGGESGRIFRIVPDNFKSTKAPQLRAATTHDLVALLAHPNGWHRDTAARLLYERREMPSAALLTNMVMRSQLPQARIQALHALDGLGALNEAVLIKSLRDRDERVREHAVALSERLADHRKLSDKAWSELGALANDPSISVRYQLAFTLGDIGRPEKFGAMAQVLGQDLTNRWFQAAVLSSVSRGAGDLFVVLAAAPRWRNDPIGLAFLSQLALMIGAKGQLDEVNQVINFLHSAGLDTFPSFTLLSALGEGLHRIGSSLALVDPQGRLQGFYDRALQAATDGSVTEPRRIASLHLLGVSSYAAADPGDALQFLLGTGESDAIQIAAIDALGRYQNQAIPTTLISRWPELSHVVRGQIVTAFLSKTDRVGAVLQPLEDGRIKPAELSPTQVDFLLDYREPGISQRARRIFGPISRARPAVVEQFKPSLRTAGVAARGRDIFRARCAECHRLSREGSRLGPDLAGAKILGKEKLLSAILEPNLEIAGGYATSVVETHGQDNLIGIISDENETTITLRQPGDVEVVWPRRNIQSIQPQTWSLMPDGMEQGLTPQAMADLLQYIEGAPK